MIDEEALKQKAKPYYDNARPGDYQHALNVVELVKELLKTENGDKDALIAAAYLHDIGYSSQYSPDKKVDWKENQKNIKLHMDKGAEITKIILSQLGYDKRFVEKVAKMVEVHDDWYNIKDGEVFILVDADNLSKLNAKYVKTKFSDVRGVIKMWERDMPLRLKTRSGKRLYDRLMPELKKDLGL